MILEEFFTLDNPLKSDIIINIDTLNEDNQLIKLYILIRGWQRSLKGYRPMVVFHINHRSQNNLTGDKRVYLPL